MSTTRMTKLSRQERWILKHAPPGDWDVKQLRELLPAADSRSRPVQSASLSRSVARAGRARARRAIRSRAVE